MSRSNPLSQVRSVAEAAGNIALLTVDRDDKIKSVEAPGPGILPHELRDQTGNLFSAWRQTFPSLVVRDISTTATGDQLLAVRVDSCADSSRAATNEHALRQQITGLKLLASSASDSMRSDDDLVWQRNISVLKGHLSCDAFAAYEFRDGHLHLQLHEGLPSHITDMLRVLKPGQAPCGVCAQQAQLLYLGGDVFQRHPQCRELIAEGFSAFVAVPLQVQGVLIGVISFVSRLRSEFDPATLDFVDTVGEIYSSAKLQQLLTRKHREAESTVQRILRDSQMVMFEADASTMDIEFLRGCGEQLLGYPEEAWLSPGFLRQRLGQPDSAGFSSVVSRLLKDRQTEFRMKHARGDKVWIEAVIEPSDGCKETSGRLRGVLRDITDRKSLEDQLRQSQKLEAIGRLAGGVAHDFNNLLTVIRTHTELIEIDNSPEQLSESLTAIQESARIASDLTSQLLMFARRSQSNNSVVNLNNIVTKAKPLLTGMVTGDAEINLHLSEQLPNVNVDESYIEQILFNLCVNARDAMQSGGTVTISTSPHQVKSGDKQSLSVEPGDYVSLCVSDNGGGMSEETRMRLFEPFFTTKPVGKGSGLGLAVAHGAAVELDGLLEVLNTSPSGTTMRVLLPATKHKLKPVKTHRQAGNSAKAGVLLVEDDTLIRNATAKGLRLHGYRVIETANGSEALQVMALKSQEITCVVSDVVMPGMSGHELADVLDNEFPHLRVVLTSGHGDESSLLHHPRHRWLQKPYTIKELVHLLDALVNENKRRHESLAEPFAELAL